MNQCWTIAGNAKRALKRGDLFGVLSWKKLRYELHSFERRNRPATVTERLLHPPDKETETSGGIWLIDGFGFCRIRLFTLHKQTRDTSPSIRGG